ncbi:MAG: glycosyltransferase [Bacteroidetes bacterium]|nr:glycosyltransferase [Bacteroidota bacterium]
MELIVKLEDELQELFNLNDYNGAVEFLEQILNKIENVDLLKSRAAYHLGKIYYYNNKFNEAEDYFRKSLTFNKEDINSLFYLGLIKEKEKKNESAIRIYSSCLETNPGLDQLHYKIQKLSLNLSTEDAFIDEVIFNVEKNAQLVKENKSLVSIIILCYNKVEYTKKCLESIFANTSYSNFEVIVVDNASVDDTSGYLEAYGNRIKFIHSNINLGFVGGNNLAIDSAEGDYVVFLNNDTEVKPKWLIGLLSVFNFYPKAGVVGSMLLFPDETLQEAGGIIFGDGSGWNYGRNDKPNASKYNFVREVDYCSGASLMVRKNILTTLGGFDTQYAPAYYEDTDLCFSARKLGYKVYYSHFSKVVHHEGITSGTDTSSGFKKYQLINKPKFEEKWKNELKQQADMTTANIFLTSNRRKGKRILIVDDIPPFPDRSSGALRHYHILKQMIELGYNVTYVHLMGKNFVDKPSLNYFAEFEMQGVEFLWFKYESWWKFKDSHESISMREDLLKGLELENRQFDLIYIAFWFIAEHFIDIIRKMTPDTMVLIDTVDIHYLREKRQAEISKIKAVFLQAEDTKKRELEVYKKADMIVTVTEDDRKEIKKYISKKPIFLLPNVHEIVKVNIPFSERNGLLFVGNFNHNPNADAVLYFIREIYPIILKKIPSIIFYIVGNNPPEEIKRLNSKNIIVTGWVPEIKPYLDKCRVSVVPLRFGAGMKGKVGETLSNGVPMVSTSIGAEGIGIENNVHSFITDESKEFAEFTVKLYQDETIWSQFSKNGKKLIDSNYSCENIRRKIKYIMKFEDKKSLQGKEALNNSSFPRYSIILITFNQIKYTLECIESIKNKTTLDYEIIVVDNASTDNTLKQLHSLENVKVIANKENLGFPKAVNQGILEAQGDYVLLINNDTVVTEGWLERMVEIAEKHQEVGIVGPISNKVSGVQLDKAAEYDSIQSMHKYASLVMNKNKGIVEEFPRVAFLCTLIKKELIDKIGGLDERFSPGNFEDDDFCLRAQLAGYKTVIAKDVFIHHYGSVSFLAEGRDKYADRLETNKKIFVNKWNGTPEQIWLEGHKITKRNVLYPVNNDIFIESLSRAMIHAEENDSELALKEIERAVESYNSSTRSGYENVSKADVINFAGKISYLLGDLEKAQKYFLSELELNPDSGRACLGLAEVFNSAEHFEEAKTMYEWAVKNDNDNTEARKGLRSVNSRLGLSENHNSLLD